MPINGWTGAGLISIPPGIHFFDDTALLRKAWHGCRDTSRTFCIQLFACTSDWSISNLVRTFL